MTFNIGSVMVIVGLWLVTAFVFGILFGKLFKKKREKEDLFTAVRSIRKFLKRKHDPNATYYVYRRKADGATVSEEVVGKPDPCVICHDQGRTDESEDQRPPLQTVVGDYIPLCEEHKEFVRQYKGLIEKELSVDEWSDNAPSE